MRRRFLAVSWLLSLALLLGAPAVRADMSVIPLPEILTDPNEGNTYGFLPVILLLDRTGRIEHIIANDVRWNRITGVFPAFRLFGYPTLDQRYYITVRKSTKIDEDYIGEYEHANLWDGRANLLANLTYFRDSRVRFFGFGNDTGDDDETNYTQERFAFRLRVGARPWREDVELAWTTRFEEVSIARGGVRGLPFTGDVFADTDGLGGSTVHAQGMSIAFDDRDSQMTPTSGTLGAARVELIDSALGSSTSFVKYGFEVRKFVPLRERFVLAMHGVLDYIAGADRTPFYERSSIGGVKSLRGFGTDRFIDANRFFSTIELRTRAYERDLFGVQAELELAPFLDAGQVFGKADEVPFDALHFVGGLGFRGIVRPQVVGFVDLGFGSDGPAVFTGLDYPF
jgi:outer membrane protein assembly factor BamA